MQRITSLSLTPAEFWILIFAERLRLRCPRERENICLSLARFSISLKFRRWLGWRGRLDGARLSKWGRHRMGRGGFGLLQVVGRQGCCVACIWILSRFVPFLRVEGGEAGSVAAGRLERCQQDGAELEVFAAGFADDANGVAGLLIDVELLVEFVIPLANALGDVAQGVFKALTDLIFEEVPLEGAKALDLFEGFVVPAAQGGFGDGELSGDGVEGEARGAKFDELVFGFVVVHRSGGLK